MVAQVGSHLPCSSMRAEAGVRKRFSPTVIQHAVFTGIKRIRCSVREGLLFWTAFPMADFYMYPEHTPIGHQEVLHLLDELPSPNFARLHVQIRGDDSRTLQCVWCFSRTSGLIHPHACDRRAESKARPSFLYAGGE